MLKQVRYIVFDLNGTLVVGHYPGYDEVLEKRLGLKRKTEGGLSEERLRQAAKGTPPFKELVRRLYDVEDPEGIRKTAFRLYASNVRLKKNVVDVLKKLGARYVLILCSDTTGVAKEVVKKFDLEKYFVKRFYSCDLGYLKSEKGFWIRCLNSFPGSKTSEFLMVGDNPRTDTYWPKRLGMHTVKIKGGISSSQDYVDKPRGTMEEEPEYSIENLEEVLDLLALS